MKNSPHRNKQRVRKEVRKAQSEEEVLHDEKKMTKTQEKQWLTSEEKLDKKSSRLKGHKSKRTSPTETGFETEPDHIHKEGQYWFDKTQKVVMDHAEKLKQKFLHGTRKLFKGWKK